MTERRMQFLVGVLVLFALVVSGVLIFLFGEVPTFASTYPVYVDFEYAPNVQVDTPVRKSGIRIGRVSVVRLNDDLAQAPVTVVVQIEYGRVSGQNPKGLRLRGDTQARIARTLLGDAAIEFVPGRSNEYLPEGSHLQGHVPPDLLGMVEDLQGKVGGTLDRWESVGGRLDTLLAKHEDEVDKILSELAVSLRSFNDAMTSANAMLGDRENQENVRRTLQQMPQMIEETREAIKVVRGAAQRADKNLEHLEDVTGVLADHTRSFVSKLDTGATKANQLLDELQLFAERFNREEGSLSQLMSNPDLYNNLNNAAFHLNELLTRLGPAVENLEIFSDTIARFPERLGVGGVVNPSPGTKPSALPVRQGSRPRRVPLRPTAGADPRGGGR